MNRLLVSIFLTILLTACNIPTLQETSSQNTPEVLATQGVSMESASADALPFEINAPIIDSPSIMSISMLDSINGWGITDTQIVRTNDGGVTWYNVTPQGVNETGYSVNPEFLDPTHAWLQFADLNGSPINGVMYRTTDGGITWTSNTTPFSDGDMSFVDSTNGWMLADLGAGAGSMAVSVFQTNDGGVTWNRTFTNGSDLETTNDSLPRAGLKYGIVPINMQTAWIHGVVYATGSVYLFRTDDGGMVWQPVQLTLPAESQTAELSVDKLQFVSSTQGTLILRSSSSKIRTLIYQTNDGGNTWSLATATVPGDAIADVVSAQEIVFYGTDQFYVTNDAGATFGIVPPDVVFGESMRAMDFATSSIGWVITSDASGHYTLYRTEDGGATWFPIIP